MMDITAIADSRTPNLVFPACSQYFDSYVILEPHRPCGSDRVAENFKSTTPASNDRRTSSLPRTHSQPDESKQKSGMDAGA